MQLRKFLPLRSEECKFFYSYVDSPIVGAELQIILQWFLGIYCAFLIWKKIPQPRKATGEKFITSEVLLELVLLELVPLVQLELLVLQALLAPELQELELLEPEDLMLDLCRPFFFWLDDRISQIFCNLSSYCYLSKFVIDLSISLLQGVFWALRLVFWQKKT